MIPFIDHRAQLERALVEAARVWARADAHADAIADLANELDGVRARMMDEHPAVRNASGDVEMDDARRDVEHAIRAASNQLDSAGEAAQEADDRLHQIARELEALVAAHDAEPARWP